MWPPQCQWHMRGRGRSRRPARPSRRAAGAPGIMHGRDRSTYRGWPAMSPGSTTPPRRAGARARRAARRQAGAPPPPPRAARARARTRARRAAGAAAAPARAPGDGVGLQHVGARDGRGGRLLQVAAWRREGGGWRRRWCVSRSFDRRRRCRRAAPQAPLGAHGCSCPPPVPAGRPRSPAACATRANRPARARALLACMVARGGGLLEGFGQAR
jgi:hypothetical protein